MVSGNSAVETITSDPVMVEVPEAEKKSVKIAVDKTTEKEELSDSIERLEITGERRSYRQPERIRVVERGYSRSRSRSPPYRKRPLTDCTVLTSTKSLHKILDEEEDACIETLKGQLVYITSHAFHTADLQKWSWLFQLGVAESWNQKPMPYLSGHGFQYELPRGGGVRGGVDYYDDGYNVRYDHRGGPVPVAKLGGAFKLIRGDSEGAGKVKFVMAVQTKSDGSWVKLVVSQSRQAAASNAFHEILNGHSIVFLGAVLRDTAIPAENPNKKARRLQRVGSVTAAEEVEQGVIGIIC
ncbi:hypothetical protein DL98DRAFT_522395 [Cadophora sp. DSE1049]|nr:hypothetical protein DL98DRAFT_522395 [Cadophora sp. DSE1049]